MRYPNPKVNDEVRVRGETGLHKVIDVISTRFVTLDDHRNVWIHSLVTRHQKTIKLYVTQVNYGDGWEDVTQSETWSEARQDIKDYRENDLHPSRQITRREPNELYQGDKS